MQNIILCTVGRSLKRFINNYVLSHYSPIIAYKNAIEKKLMEEINGSFGSDVKLVLHG
jgi:hypothetical protein